MMCGVVHIGCPYVYAVLNSCASSGGLSVVCVCVCVCMHVHKDDWFTRARGAPLRAIQLSGQSLKIGKSM